MSLLCFLIHYLIICFPKRAHTQNQQAATRSYYYSSVSLQSWINGAGRVCEKGLEALIRHSCFWRGAKHGGQPRRKLPPRQPAESCLSEATGKEEEDYRFLTARIRLCSWLRHSCGYLPQGQRMQLYKMGEPVQETSNIAKTGLASPLVVSTTSFAWVRVLVWPLSRPVPLGK